MKEKEGKKTQGGMGYVLKLAGKSRWLLFASGICSVLSGLCSFVPYVMVYRTLMFLFEKEQDYTKAFQYGIIAVVAILGRFLLTIISGGFSHIGAFNTLYEVRAELSKHISKVNLGFFTQHNSGFLKKVIIEDIERIEQFLAHQIPDIAAAVVVPVCMLIYMFTINVKMSLALLLPLLLGAIIMIITMAITGSQMGTYHKLLGKSNSAIMQFMNGMPVMKTYNMPADAYKEYADTIKEYNRFWKRCTRLQGYPYGIFVALVESGILFVLPIGGYLYLNNQLTVSAYFFFMIMSLVFLSSLLNLSNFAMLYSQISTGVGRIQEIMEIPRSKQGVTKIDKKQSHKLEFKNVSFGYENTEVLHNISLTLPAGSFTAFVGASGAGKTTAAQLIPKYWEVTKGSISIAGHSIRSLENGNLMDNVSFVFQETFMLNDTIYENIVIGSQKASKEEVENAAKAAQIHDFIMTLPKGYQTHIGENGVKMSGGEKQRVCIARAILKDAPIIIFDEATSYTDIENEHKIQVALFHLLKGKTTIMIAHRLHTIVNADQICVFDRGNIIETGTHEKLCAANGKYASMWNTYTREEVQR
jgi:ABC-type multidrug transport system, ATPase and permease components